MATHSPRRPRPAGVFWWVGGTPSPPAPLPVGEGERRVFTFTPVIPAPPSFPRRRESPCPPGTGFYLHPRHSRTPVIPAKAGIHAPLPPRDGFLPSPPSFPHPRHSREGGNPRTPAPQGRVFTFTPVIPAPPSFPRRRESTHPCPPGTGFYLHPRHSRHSREGGNPRTPAPQRRVFTFTPVIPAKAGIHAPLPPRDGFLPSPPSFPHPRHSREGGNPRTPAPQGRVFTFTPVIPAPPSFPRRRESTHPCPPGTGFYLHPRHSREGGNPRTPGPSPGGRGGEAGGGFG